jgi:pyruvoyl-dependent arginine decarboxylase (PvlArgDC)
MHQYELPVDVGNIGVVRREDGVSSFGGHQRDVNVHDVRMLRLASVMPRSYHLYGSGSEGSGMAS